MENLDRFENDPALPAQEPEESVSIDDFIRELHEELEHCDAVMDGKERTENREEPAFRPELPREYAELTLDQPAPAQDADEPVFFTPGRKALLYVVFVLLMSLALAFFGWKLADDVCAFTQEDRTVTVTVGENDTVNDVTASLQEAGLVKYPWLFRFYCRFAHADRKIIPGVYELNAVFDYHALVSGMSSSELRATVSVTIPEGYECDDIFTLLESKGVCSAQALRKTAAETEFDYRFLDGVPMNDENRLEGCLFPDTYFFYMGDDPERVLNKMLSNLENKLTEQLWDALDLLNATLAVRKHNAGFSQQQIDAEALTMHDILIVASLIEKETATASEDSIISSVIYNRLCSRDYPCLNIDATIQYALAERKEILLDSDKLIDSPYNTYKYPGLPVGPIASPGMLAIRGALYPKDTNYYFYALGRDGTHTFNCTYLEHLEFLEGLKNEG